MPVHLAQQLRYVQDATALVMSQWERADPESRRVLMERLSRQYEAARAALESDLATTEVSE